MKLHMFMNSITKRVINFFSSTYNNNLKFNNRFVSTSKIFFERTTKSWQSVQALGNVYRNSKWSDLNIFNIKESFLPQFKSTFNVLIIFFMVMTFTNYVDLIPFFNSLFVFKDFLMNTVDFFLDLFVFIFMSIAFSIWRFINYFSNKLGLVIISDQLDQKNENLYYPTHKYKIEKASLNKDKLTNKDFLKIAYDLQKVVKYLHLINTEYLLSSKDFNNTCNNTDLLTMFLDKPTLIQYVFFINSKSKYNLTDSNFDKFSNKDSLFYNCSSYDDFFKTYSYILDMKTFRLLSPLMQREFNFIISKNLDKGKESRWLIKNSLLSHDFVSKTFTTTNVKKLYSNNTINVSSKMKNLWISNRIKSTRDYISTIPLENNTSTLFLKNNFLTKSHLSYLDKVESGFYWLLNRFKFFQTSTTYQYFHRRLHESSPEMTHNFFGKTELLKTCYFLNMDPYSLHNLNKLFSDDKNSRLQSSFSSTLLVLLTSFDTNAFDLNFAKYLLSSINLEKKKVKIYSNLNL